jgi:hypothetical protein
MTEASTSCAAARELFGAAMLAPDDVGGALGIDTGRLTADDPTARDRVPYDRGTLERARTNGEMLVFRTAVAADTPLTLMHLLERFPEAVHPRLLKGVGYQLKDEWTVGQEPFATAATCRPGWRLVHTTPVPTTCNLSYELQSAALERYAESRGLAGRLARRSAIEAAYDTVLVSRVHGTRLLQPGWDWAETPTEDGGFVAVGDFGREGLHLLGYSRAVRFGNLGVCPQY